MILKKLDKTLDLRFYGEHPDPDIRHFGKLDSDAEAMLLSEAHVLVDMTQDQGFGHLGLKAMACNTLYFALHNKGVDDYCEHDKNAILCKANDPFAMAMSIMDIKLQEKYEKRKAQIAKGIEMVQNFDIRETATKFEAHIKKILTKK
jgi:glycosyltransferase involved in cell wall biosynthesis